MVIDFKGALDIRKKNVFLEKKVKIMVKKFLLFTYGNTNTSLEVNENYTKNTRRYLLDD